MKIAVKAVQSGAKLRQTATLYNIPVMTLSDYVKQSRNCRTVCFKRMGRKPVFTTQQENEIKEHILCLSRKFYGLTPHSLKTFVYEYAEQNQIKNPFNKTSKEAGKDWLYGFLKRNPEISIRRPEATSVNRIFAFNSHEVNLYFDNLSACMMKHKFPPHRIFNVDETGINSVHRPEKILAQKGLCNICPMPNKNKKQQKSKGQDKRSKQHSIILTSTPMKTLLENKEKKKMINKERENNIKKQLKERKKAIRDSKNPIEERIKKQTKKRRNHSTSSSEVDENILCVDDHDNDGRFYDEGQSGIDELCIICGEFGKNNELWYRCVSCGKWAHAMCSGEESADNYLCGFCQ